MQNKHVKIAHKFRRLLLTAAAVTTCTFAYAQEQFSRDIEQITFIPKGQWITGVSVNYSQSNQDNYQFLVVEGLNADSYSFKVSPMLMYAFQDNMAAGGRFAYSRQRTRLDNATVVLDSETSYDVDHLYVISHNYYGTAAYRYYMNLGNNTRFGLFAEAQLQLGGGQSKIENGSGLDYTGTFERNFSLNCGLAPGMVMFLNNYSAIEVNVGVLGYDYTHTRSVTDQIYIANRTTKSANFRINLFSITFGCTFYI
jgi:hypothetical protein